MSYDLRLARARIFHDPVCEARPNGRYCPRLAASVALVPGVNPEQAGAYRSRCPDHRGEGAPLLCLGCGAVNEGSSGDLYRCPKCQDARPMHFPRPR